MENQMLPKILTEEELQEHIRLLDHYRNMGQLPLKALKAFNEVVASHRALKSDYDSLLTSKLEISFENMLRKKYEGFLNSVIMSGETLQEGDDFEGFKTKTKDWDWKVIPCKTQ